MSDIKLIDISGFHPGLHDQAIEIGNNQRQLFASGYNSANRVHGQLMNNSILGSSDIDAFQLIFGGNPAFCVFADATVSITHFLRNFAAGILVDVNDLQVCLRDFAFSLSIGAWIGS